MALFLSTSSDASRMVIAIWFGVCMFRMCSNSAPGMFFLCTIIRVGLVVVLVLLHVLLWASDGKYLLSFCVGIGYVPSVRGFVDDFVPCLMYSLCGCCYRFGQLSMLLGCW